METKFFTLLELLQARVWLMDVMNSNRNFVRVEVSKEQIAKAVKRIKEIDQELVDRLLEWKDQEFIGKNAKVFEDKNFEQTLEGLSGSFEE